MKKKSFGFTDRSGKVHGVSARKLPQDQDTPRERSETQSAKKPLVKPNWNKSANGPDRQKKEHPRAVQPRGERPSNNRFKNQDQRTRPPEKISADNTPSKRPHNDVRLKGTFDKNRKGFGFVGFADRKREDAFVPPHLAERLFHGDRVEVRLDRRGEVLEINVLEHRFREVVGRWVPSNSQHTKSGHVVYERKKAREEIYIPKGAPATTKAGDWVRAVLTFDSENPNQVEGQVVEVFGRDLPARIDVTMIAAEYNLHEAHSPESEAQAKSFTLDVEQVLKSDPARVDLRHIPFITIDGETARDFDDAVYVERSDSGYVLWVAIADVSHYVAPNTPLDVEARSRGTSVYFPERAFHMLPRALSENLCSLKPDEPRLVMAAQIDFNSDGLPTHTKIMNGVILSKRRATYNEIQAEWDEFQKAKPADWKFLPHFELYKLIRAARTKRGSIDFEFPEAELKVEPTGEVISIKVRPRMDAHRLIEEFMIAANEAVTEWALSKNLPFIYRVHDEPADKALDRFERLCTTLGIPLEFGDKGSLQAQMGSFIEHISEHPAKNLLNTMLLRSMKQAIYTSLHAGHFGLASRAYTHFTSPIRRYPDLIVHRMLKIGLEIESKQTPALTSKQLEETEKSLEESAEHCSYRERLASDAERDSIKLKQVRCMIPFIGQELEGKVNGLSENGMFISLLDPFVEGFINRDALDDDFYQYDEDHMVFFGRRTRRVFRIGDRVKIRVDRADIDSRQIDFGLVEHTPSEAASPLNFQKKPDQKKREGQPKKKGAKGGRGQKRGANFAKKSGKKKGRC